MSKIQTQNLQVDELGRFILDVYTPAERIMGRTFGCLTWLSGFVALALLGTVMGGDFGLISKLLRIAGLVMIVGFFYRCRQNIDCYYVLDEVGGQLLYHFSAIMIVAEDPVADLENVCGIGVSYTGHKISLGTGTWAVFFCLSDGRLIRVSNFFEHPDPANTIAKKVAELIKIPLLTCNPGEKKMVAVTNGLMIHKAVDSLLSVESKDKAVGCLTALFILPYAFWPAFILIFLAFSIVSGSSADVSIESFRERREFGYVEADGTLLPQLDKRRNRIMAENPQSAADYVASGTIVPGKGIIGLISIGEEMSAVLARFNLPPVHVEVPEKTGYNRYLNKYVAPAKVRQDILNGAISLEFTSNSAKEMRLSRIEIFRGKELPFKTSDMIGFGESAKKLFKLGDGNIGPSNDEGYEYQAANPDATFYTRGNNLKSDSAKHRNTPKKKQYGLAFYKQGIAYSFDGDRLIEIEITERRR